MGNNPNTILTVMPMSKNGIELVTRSSTVCVDLQNVALRVNLSDAQRIDLENSEHNAVFDEIESLHNQRDKILAALALGTILCLSRYNREHALQLCLPDGTEYNPKAYFVDCSKGAATEADNQRFVGIDLLTSEESFTRPRKGGSAHGFYRQVVITKDERRIVLVGYVPKHTQSFETNSAIISADEAEKTFVVILVNVEVLAEELYLGKDHSWGWSN